MTDPIGYYLAALADRAKSDPCFLAHALAEYADREELDDDELAERLGCPVESLPLVRLRRTPATLDDVRRIAARYGCRGRVLAQAVGWTRAGQG